MIENANTRKPMGKFLRLFVKTIETNKKSPIATAKRNIEVQESNEGVTCIFKI